MILHHSLRALQIALGASCLYLAYASVAVWWSGRAASETALPPAAALEAAMASPAAYEIIGQRNLFRALRAPATPLAPADENLEESNLRLRLLGTVAAIPTSLSLATLEDLGTRESLSVRIGDRIAGATVLDIQRRRIVIENNGRREAISIDDEDTAAGPGSAAARAATGSTAARTPSPANASPRRARVAQPTRGTSSSSASASRAGSIDPSVMSLAAQVQFAPSYGPDGSIAGLQIQQVTPGSAMEAAGMEAGMLCTEMNGVPISSLGSLGSVLQPTPGSQTCITCIAPNGAAVTHCF